MDIGPTGGASAAQVANLTRPEEAQQQQPPPQTEELPVEETPPPANGSVGSQIDVTA